MPLKKSASKEAFMENFRKERQNKPLKQALAIAYATQEAAKKKSAKKTK